MGKKVRKRTSNEENSSLQALEKTVKLDSTCDTDIIECSIADENNHEFLKKGKLNCKGQISIQSPRTPLQNICSDNKALRCSLSSRKNNRLVEEKTLGATTIIKTPYSIKNSNSVVKKIISTLKKTPDGPYLSISKLQNIEKWLRENEVETVRTPPFANLSVTPVNSLKKKWSSRRKEESVRHDESSIDSEVEGVLKAVYGDDWQRKNIHRQTRTEPKKKSKRFFSPTSQNKKDDDEDFDSVRRNILNIKKLNFDDKSNEENCFDDSVLSGVKMINLDSSNCSDEIIKTNLLKTLRVERKYEAKVGSLESLCFSSAEKKKAKKVEILDQAESKKQNRKASASKKRPNDEPRKTPKKTFLASLSVSTPTSKCHPDAQYYKINFKLKKEELVKKLYKLYNSEVFDGKLAEDMSFSWNVKLRGTAGYCFNKRVTKSSGEVLRISRVEFSTKIVDRADRLRDTMIHELCHAASWVIDGTLDGHGDVWSKWASRAVGRFPELPPIKRCHNYDIVSKFVYRCTGCGYSIKRHSKSIDTERKRCGHCYGVLELLINKKRKGKNEVPEFDTTRTLPTPNKFAMFVKENYHSVKSTKINAKHSEIMKILSQKYASFKNGSNSAKK